MNTLGNPTVMAIANALMFVFSALESAGITNMLGQSKSGVITMMVLTALNGAAHALSNPEKGPLR